MQFRLRTLLIVLAVGPLVIAVLWPIDASPPNRRLAMAAPRGVEYDSGWDLPYPDVEAAATNELSD